MVLSPTGSDSQVKLEKTISLSIKNITLMGDKVSRTTIYSINHPIPLFKVSASISISVFNVIFKKTGLLTFKSATSSTDDQLVIKIHDSTFQQSPVVVDIVARTPMGPSYINISNSWLINCTKGVWVDANNHSTNLTIFLTNSVFENIGKGAVHIQISNGSHFDERLPPLRTYKVKNTSSGMPISADNNANLYSSTLTPPETTPVFSSNCKVTVVIDVCKFKSNQITSSSGGAIYFHGRYGVNLKVEIKDTKFIYNKAYSKGGAVFIDGHFGNNFNVFIENTSFIENVATTSGGAIQFSVMSRNVVNITMTSTEFTRNEAGEYGSAICLTVGHGNAIEILIHDILFIRNNAGFAGMGHCINVNRYNTPG